MGFRNSTTSYGQSTKAARTPFERAAREWDNRLGTLRQQAVHWRIVALVALIATVLLGGGLVHLAGQQRVQTYVVEVDRAGLPGRIELLTENVTADATVIGYFVGELVRWVRERPVDPVVLRGNWQRAYHFLAGPAIRTMNEFAIAETAALRDSSQAIARTVTIQIVLAQSEKSFQVRWQEVEYVGGDPQPPRAYTGLFHVEQQPPRDDAERFQNPLGLYVRQFTWSREFGGPVDIASERSASATTANESEE